MLELRSKVLVDSVLEKLESVALEKVKSKPGSSLMVLLIEFFHHSLVNNKLLFAKPELDEINDLLQEDDCMKLNYKRGTVLISQKVGNYHAKFRISVPDTYPETPVTFKLLENNFHPVLTTIFIARIQHLVRRILKGYRYSLPGTVGKKKEGSSDFGPPSSSDLHEIRKDLQFLKKVQDLKEQSNDASMRRAHARLLKSEAKNMTEKEQQLLAQEESFEEQQRNMQKAMDRRTLYPVAAFIMKELVMRLPNAICAECNSNLLPDTPPNCWGETTSAAAMDKSIRVERISCDHWYHFSCLEKIMGRPPFDDKKCLVESCDSSIEHPHFNIKYIRAAERKYLKKEERKRELADIADFMS